MRLPRKKKRGETKEKTFITGVKTWNLTPCTRKIIPFLRSSSRTDPRHSGLHVEQENQISPVLLVHLCLPQGQRAFSEPAPLPGWSFTTSETAQTPQNKIGEDDCVQPRYKQVSWREQPSEEANSSAFWVLACAVLVMDSAMAWAAAKLRAYIFHGVSVYHARQIYWLVRTRH